MAEDPPPSIHYLQVVAQAALQDEFARISDNIEAPLRIPNRAWERARDRLVEGHCIAIKFEVCPHCGDLGCPTTRARILSLKKPNHKGIDPKTLS